jgi:hypothetical protein
VTLLKNDGSLAKFPNLPGRGQIYLSKRNQFVTPSRKVFTNLARRPFRVSFPAFCS